MMTMTMRPMIPTPVPSARTSKAHPLSQVHQPFPRARLDKPRSRRYISHSKFRTRKAVARIMSTRTTSKRELAAEIGSLLGDLAVRSKRSLRPLLEAEGVTMPQAMLLQALQRAGGRQSARELGRECHMLASTVTGVIDRLEAAGLVQRERDSRDRRIVWVVLTGDGEELVGRLPSFFEHLGKAFTVLPARELEQMRVSLLRALAAGEDEGER